MTEERYSLDHTVVPQPLIREHGVCMEIGVVVDKLNMLSEERNQFQFQYNMEVLKRQSLEKENEQLKLQLQSTSDQRDEFHRGARENANRVGKLKKENEQLEKELKVYRKLARCSNCEYHGYDWFSDGEEFEVCEKGNDVTERICEDWRKL